MIQTFFQPQEEVDRVILCLLILNLTLGIHGTLYLNLEGVPEALLLFNTVLAYRTCQAIDPRDKIYALLGLLTDRRQEDILAFTPNYDISIQDLYKKFARYFISKQCGK